MKYFIGIDWSGQYDDICIVNEVEEVLKEFRIEISKTGFNLFMETIKTLKCKKADIYFGIETDKNILAEYLISKGYNVYNLNPLCVHRFKQMYSPTAKKDDKYDAYSLALILLKDKNKFKPVCKSSAEVEELQIHIETENMLLKQRTRLIQQLRNALSLYFPAFCQFFNKLDTSVPVNLLKAMNDINKMIALSFEEYIALIKDVKYMSLKRKTDFFNLIKEKVINFDSPTIQPLSFRVCMLSDQIIVINENLKIVQNVIEKIYHKQELANVFSSLPYAGPKLAPKLLVNFGDNQQRFSSFQSVQCYSGTAPITEKSGKYLHNIKMRRACKKSFRNTLHQFAFCSLKGESWAREYYDQLRSRGKSHSSAIRSLSNKWVKIIFRMWKNNTEYDASIFVNSKKRQRSLNNVA